MRKNLAVISICILILSTGLLGADNTPGKDFRFPVMIRVPAGTAVIGFGTKASSSPSGPAHKVTIDEYEMGKFEITNGEYVDMLNYAVEKGHLADGYVSNETVRNKEGRRQDLLILNETMEGVKSEIRYDAKTKIFVVENGKERRPVVYVTWYGAAFYCNMLSEKQGLAKMYDLADWSLDLDPKSPGYRLPTEAEWEYAARFDDNNMDARRRILPWGWPWEKPGYMPSDDELRTYANYNLKPGKGGTKDVGSYESGKSKLGIYDLAGNVSEWIQDFYAPYQGYDKTNPVDNTSGVYRQRRGGGWLYYANNFLWSFYHTDTNYPFVYYVDFGFRIVKSGAKLIPIIGTPPAVK